VTVSAAGNRCAQVLEEGVLHVAEHVELALAVIADTGIDHRSAALRAQREALKGDDHLAVALAKCG